MSLEEFKASLSQETPPDSLDSAQKALWYAGKDDWQRAHEFAQQKKDSESAWVHAYLHRQEGDILNAEYWYVRASKKLPNNTLQEEWEDMVHVLIERKPLT